MSCTVAKRPMGTDFGFREDGLPVGASNGWSGMATFLMTGSTNRINGQDVIRHIHREAHGML